MQTETQVREDSTLAAVRRRSQGYLGFVLWVLFALFVLWALNMVASLVERWVAMLYGVRHAAGLATPVSGPDYWIMGGVALLALIATAAIAGAYAAYRAAWNRRLRLLWSTPTQSSHVRIRPLRARADEVELQRRAGYLKALASSSEWGSEWNQLDLENCADPRQAYKNAAAVILRSVE